MGNEVQYGWKTGFQVEGIRGNRLERMVGVRSGRAV